MSSGSGEETDPISSLTGDQLAALVGTAGDLLVFVDSKGKILRLAELGSTTLGYQSESLIGRSVTALFPDELSVEFGYDITTATDFRQAVQEGKRDRPVLPLEAADGRIIPYTLSASTQEGTETVCLLREIDTPESGSNSHVPLTEISDPVYVLDAEQQFARINDAMIEYTGYDREELLGRSCEEILPASRQKREVRQIAGVASTGESEMVETALLTARGELLLVEVHVTARTDESGEYTGAVGVLRDIRERKRRESDLELLKQVLTRLFRHNVRNELMVATSHVEHLDEQIDETLQSHTEAISHAANRLLDHSEKARFIEQVIETNERSEIDLVSVIETQITAARERYPSATIETDLPDDQMVLAHPDIHRAIEELIENAVTHCPTGESASLNIWLDRQHDGETLFIEDESGGLSEEELAVLREGEEDDLEHGSGVGLWLVRLLVEYSGAEMIVHRTGEGTLTGIRFGELTRESNRGPVEHSPVIDAPEHVRDVSLEQFDGDTVVGRSGALDRLVETYETLETTGGHSVLITGEAGIGKTTLIDRFHEEISGCDNKPVFVSSDCSEDTQAPYHAFRQILRELPTGRDLEDLFETIASLSAADPAERRQYRRSLFADIAQQLRSVATERPVIVVIEDMHWADRGTIDLFAYLLEEVGQWRFPIAFVGTYQPAEIDDSHPLVTVGDETTAAGRGTVLELEPFGDNEIRALLLELLGLDTVPEPFVQAVSEHTGGIPLFINEVGRHLVETRGPFESAADLPDSLDELTLPPTVDSAVTERLSGLPEAVRSTLELGAVIGQEFSFDLLWEASDQPTDTLIDCIQALTKRGLWTRSEEQLSFVHGVVREQTRTSLASENRTRLHERVAGAIETVHADSLDAYSPRLAIHYEKAGAYRKAFEYYHQAASSAAAAYVHEDAIEHYEKALSLEEYDLIKPGALATVATELGDTLELLGEYDRAATQYERSLKHSETANDHEGKAESYRHLGKIAFKRGEYEQAEVRYTRSLELTRESDDRQGTAESLTGLGYISDINGQYEQAWNYYNRGLDIFREIGDREGEAKALHNLALVAKFRRELDQAQEYYEESLRIEREIGNRKGEAETLNDLGVLADGRGNHERAREYHEQALAIRREISDQRGVATTLHNLGLIAQNCGEYERAHEYYGQSLEIEQQIGNRKGEAASLNALGEIASSRGEYGTAREYHERSLSIRQEIGDRRGESITCENLGRIAAKCGEYDQAYEFLTDSTEIAEAIGAPDQESDGRRVLAALYRKRGELNKAKQQLTASLEACDREDNPRQFALIRLEESRLALAEDDIALARRTLAEADRNLSTLEAPHATAQTLFVQGQVAAASGAQARARECWQETLERFQQLGATDEQLRTLRQLAELSQEPENEWLQRARALFEDTPPTLKEQHEDWLG